MREALKYPQHDKSYTIFIKENGLVLNKRTFISEEQADEYANNWVSGKIQFLTE